MIDFWPACDVMAGLVAGVPDGRLDDGTPCADYRVRDLVAHVEQVARGFAATARGEDGGTAPLEFAPGWRERVADDVRGLAAAWAEPAAWRGVRAPGGLELSAEVWGKIAFTEIVVHGWDLARATDQAFALPDATVRACLAHVEEFVPNAPVPQLWGPAVAVPDDAPLIDRVVAITGRTP